MVGFKPHSLKMVMLCLGGLLLCNIAGWVFPYTMDSLIHISTAENILRHNGLQFSSFFVEPPGPDQVPVQLAPPGFGIAIALLGWAGINVYKAALAIPAVSYLALPFLFFAVFRRFLPTALALWATGISFFSFHVAGCAAIAWSDIPYLSLALSVFILTFRVIENQWRSTAALIFLIGVLAGTALLFRFVGASLILAVVGAASVVALRREISWTAYGRFIGIFTAGTALILVPYLLRNMLVLGTVYKFQEGITALEYMQHAAIVSSFYLKGLSVVVFGRPFLWPVVLMVIIATLVAAIRSIVRARTVRSAHILLATLYFVFYSLFLIHGKSVAFYINNVDVDERLMIQLAWMLEGCLVYGVYRLFSPISHLPWGRIGLAVFVGIWCLLQIYAGMIYYDKQTRIKALAHMVKQYSPVDLAAGVVLVSNVPDILYYFSGRNVRALGPYTPWGLVNILGPHRDFAVVLFKKHSRLSPAWIYSPSVWRNPLPGYRCLYTDDNVEVFMPLPEALKPFRSRP